MLIEIHPQNPDERKIKQVVNCLKNGGLIIYPTDTVYGLGCDIYNPKALERLARLKGVKLEKANFSFVCNDLSHISEFTQPFNTSIFKIMKANLPGPFTFILNANNSIPKLFKNNKKTVGIRIPDNIIARTIAKELGNPIVSTSIHSGDQIIDYLNDPYEIHEQFEKLVDIVIDGGVGDIIPSTIVDCTEGESIIIRQGKGIL